jgi:hypothetical protein
MGNRHEVCRWLDVVYYDVMIDNQRIGRRAEVMCSFFKQPSY